MGKAEKKTVFEIQNVLLQYAREMGSTMTSLQSCKAHHANVSEQTVHVCNKSRHVGMCFLKCTTKSMVSSTEASVVKKNEKDAFLRVGGTEKIYVTAIRKNGEKNSVVPSETEQHRLDSKLC